MKKNILVTGATDGIGLATSKTLVKLGHNILIHGRSADKLAVTKALLEKNNESTTIDMFCADLSKPDQTHKLGKEISKKYDYIDVLINNAGVFKTAQPLTEDGYDSRFMVNTIAPYILTKMLLPLMSNTGRVINLSSAAQAPVKAAELIQTEPLSDSMIYAKSKLAITMWSRHLAEQIKNEGPVIVAVNPASLLGSKMVKDAYGVVGGDIQIGADILVKAALSNEFSEASGRYFDNDIGAFAKPHPDALNRELCAELVQELDGIMLKNGIQNAPK